MFYKRRNDRQREKIQINSTQLVIEVFVTYLSTEKELIPLEITFLPTWVKYVCCIAKIVLTDLS